MTDRRRIPHPELIARTLPPGAAVILRDYDDPARAAVAARLASVCATRRLKFLVGADPALAAKVGADLHLPARLLHDRRPCGAAPALSASCHTFAEMQTAALIGVQIIFLSPVFATQSHPGAQALGPRAFKAFAAKSSLPVLALGGVDEHNAPALAGPCVAGIGAIGAFLARPAGAEQRRHILAQTGTRSR